MVSRVAASSQVDRYTKERAMMVLRPAAILDVCRVDWELESGYPGRHAQNMRRGFLCSNVESSLCSCVGLSLERHSCSS